MNQLSYQCFLKLLKLITYAYAILFLLSSCGNADDQTPHEGDYAYESLNNLKSDAKFNDLVSRCLSSANQATDYARAHKLYEKQEELSQQEKLELAIALGYESVQSMNESHNILWDSWIEVVARFGLIDYEADEVSQIYIEVVKKLTLESNLLGRLYDDERDQFCKDQFYRCSQGAFERNFRATGEMCKLYLPFEDDYDPVNIISCDEFQPDSRAHAQMLTILAGCEFQYECCLIGYDSNDCMLMF